MTGLNHATTGAVIALVVKQPALALPLAFMSHFVLDALPHFGVDYEQPDNHGVLKKAVIIDATLTASFFLILIFFGFWLAVAGAVLAVLPDVVWFVKYAHDKYYGRPFSLPKDWFSRAHKKIQWGEHPKGWIIEIIWLVLAAPLLFALL